MNCRRCGCTETRACRLELGNGETVACSWVIPGLCSGCLTDDEQQIIATFVEGTASEIGGGSIEQQRADFEKLLIARVLPALVTGFGNWPEAVEEVDHVVEAARLVANKAARLLFPDPEASDEPDLGDTAQARAIHAQLPDLLKLTPAERARVLRGVR